MRTSAHRSIVLTYRYSLLSTFEKCFSCLVCLRRQLQIWYKVHSWVMSIIMHEPCVAFAVAPQYRENSQVIGTLLRPPAWRYGRLQMCSMAIV